jgi:hypothetical protein
MRLHAIIDTHRSDKALYTVYHASEDFCHALKPYNASTVEIPVSTLHDEAGTDLALGSSLKLRYVVDEINEWFESWQDVIAFFERVRRVVITPEDIILNEEMT